MGDAAPILSRRRTLAGAVVIVVAASAAAWALAAPQVAPAASLVRALADCAAVASLGLAAVPSLDAGRYRDELARRAAGPLAWAAGVWLFAELCRLVQAAAAAAGVPVTRVSLDATMQFALAISAGRAGLFSVAAAALVVAVALFAPKTSVAAVAATGAAATGLVARTIGGHMSGSAFGGIAIAVHVLAAALWCGTLVALVLTVDHRGQWARVLPRFSDMSLWCVIALLAGGVVGALVALPSPAELFTTGYGRLLLTKIVLTVVLLALAWRNRARWLPAAKSHHVTAAVSRSRSLVELAIMAMALTMAAALSVTG